MKKVWHTALICVVLLSLFSSLTLYAFAIEQQAHLMVVEWYGRGRGRVILYSIPPEDDSMKNPDYELLPFWWHTTIKILDKPEKQVWFFNISSYSNHHNGCGNMGCQHKL